MKTAEEFFREKLRKLHPQQNAITLSQELITAEQGMRWAQEYSILKAEFHVEAALKAASEEVEYDCRIDWCDPYDYSAGLNGLIDELDKDSILNAYPLTNIK